MTGILGSGSLGSFILGNATPSNQTVALSILTLTQSAHCAKSINLGVNSTIGLQSIPGKRSLESLSATLTFIESATSPNTKNTSLSATLTLIESATAVRHYVRAALQSLTIVSSTVDSHTTLLSVSQSLTFATRAYRAYPENITSTLTLISTATETKLRFASASQSITIVSASTAALVIHRSIFHGLPLVSQGARRVAYVKAATNVLTLTTSALGVQSKPASNTLVFTQTATPSYVHGARSALILTQIVSTTNTLKRATFTNFIPFQVLAYHATFHRTIQQGLTLTQSAIGYLTHPATNTLVLSTSAIAVKVKPASNTLTLSQTLSVSHTQNVSTSSVLSINQKLKQTRSYGQSIAQVLGLTSVARGAKGHSLSASQTLTFHQTLIRDLHIAIVPQTLTLVSGATCIHRSSPITHQNLNLRQSVHVSTTLVRSVTSPFQFLDSFIRYAGSYPITVAGLQGVVVKSLVILQTPTNAVVLPAPEFNDKEAGTGVLTIKRSMDGTRRVYKRTSTISKLTYDFVMDRIKALELRYFLLGSNSQRITLTNWKGEIWSVVLTNSPFSFEEVSYREGLFGNKSTITLEFEGVRLN